MKITEMAQHLNPNCDDEQRANHPGEAKGVGPNRDVQQAHAGEGPKTGGPVNNEQQAAHAGDGPKTGGPVAGPAADGVDRSDAEKLRQLLDNPIFGGRPRP
jgi:hypothetical protein